MSEILDLIYKKVGDLFELSLGRENWIETDKDLEVLKRINIENFGIESKLFPGRPTLPHFAQMTQTINALVKEIIIDKNSVLDVGIGNGERIKSICEGVNINIYGIDLSAHALSNAKKIGARVVIADMEKALPFRGLDAIVYVSNDFHYLFTHELRTDALNSAYQSLNKKGVLFMEIPYLENLESIEDDFRIVKYYRHLKIGPIEFDCLPHYIGVSKFDYVKRMINESKFNPEKACFRYVIINNEDAGKVMDVKPLPNLDTRYRLVLTLEK